MQERECSSPHSREERDIWKAEKEGRFDREEIMTYLKSSQLPKGASASAFDAGDEDEIPKGRSSESRVHGTHQESSSSQKRGSTKPSVADIDSFDEGPHGMSTLRQKGDPRQPTAGKTSQTASASHHATEEARERTSNRKVPEQTPRMKATAAPSCQMSSQQLPPHLLSKIGPVQQLMARISGRLLVACRSCLNNSPQMISFPRSQNPKVCTYDRGHQMKNNRCLLYEGGNEYKKVRECPFKNLFNHLDYAGILMIHLAV